jgi:UDP-glucose-4-epimerase GalE
LSKILVTGGSGYVGSHVAKMLYEQGYDPFVFDLQAKLRPWASPKWNSVSGDINNKWALDRVFREEKFDAVIHLAASSEVGASVTDPLRYYQNNVGGTATLLQVCNTHKVNKFIFSSTSSVYGEVDPSKLPTKEDHTKTPATSYGSSKWTVESMLRDADVAYNIKSVSLRYFNASGASPDGKIGEVRPKPSHLIPSLQAVVDGKREEFVINGNDYPTPDGTAVRDFTHVWDIAQAHVNALEYLLGGGKTDSFNIGAGAGKSVLEMFVEFQQQSGVALPMKVGPRRPGDIPMNFADISKAREILNWIPVQSDAKSIVRDAVNWYQSDLYKNIVHGNNKNTI